LVLENQLSTCPKMKFITDISEYGKNCETYCNKRECKLPGIIKRGIENQIVFKAKEKYSIDRDGIFDYIRAEIANATERMSFEKNRSYHVDYEQLNLASFNYIWNKERIKALNKFKKEIESPDKKEPQQIQLPENILKWLQETICSNGKPFIEDASTKPFKWLQNKRNAFIFITHENIRGNFGVNEAARQAEQIFIDRYGNPLNKLSSTNKKDESTDTKKLRIYLADSKNFPTTVNN